MPDDRTLSQMLAAGEIDGLVSARAPSCFLAGAPNVGAAVSRTIRRSRPPTSRRPRIFPIMHAIGIRRSLVEQHPWLAVSVYKAFLKAKQIAMAELGQIGHLAVSLPWCVADYEHARASLGADYWSYGANENRHVLEKLARYSFEQGLSVRKLPFEEMFAPSTYDLTKI